MHKKTRRGKDDRKPGATSLPRRTRGQRAEHGAMPGSYCSPPASSLRPLLRHCGKREDEWRRIRIAGVAGETARLKKSLPGVKRGGMSAAGAFLLPADAGQPKQRDVDGAGGPIYLDYNATTPLDPAVAAAMLPVSVTCAL